MNEGIRRNTEGSMNMETHINMLYERGNMILEE